MLSEGVLYHEVTKLGQVSCFLFEAFESLASLAATVFHCPAASRNMLIILINLTSWLLPSVHLVFIFKILQNKTSWLSGV